MLWKMRLNQGEWEGVRDLQRFDVFFVLIFPQIESLHKPLQLSAAQSPTKQGYTREETMSQHFKPEWTSKTAAAASIRYQPKKQV